MQVGQQNYIARRANLYKSEEDSKNDFEKGLKRQLLKEYFASAEPYEVLTAEIINRIASFGYKLTYDAGSTKKKQDIGFISKKEAQEFFGNCRTEWNILRLKPGELKLCLEELNYNNEITNSEAQNEYKNSEVSLPDDLNEIRYLNLTDKMKSSDGIHRLTAFEMYELDTYNWQITSAVTNKVKNYMGISGEIISKELFYGQTEKYYGFLDDVLGMEILEPQEINKDATLQA
ncbi:MAG TPA: hypothetical protein DCP90_02340 [Clostridiales bacterium]|nr:MAG: hypothetical protein A2Y22_05195 [Clostridiales bacterium GWD2_32_59]HAN09434.1 hypothetical protein [Clostridiales bacterium]